MIVTLSDVAGCQAGGLVLDKMRRGQAPLMCPRTMWAFRIISVGRLPARTCVDGRPSLPVQYRQVRRHRDGPLLAVARPTGQCDLDTGDAAKTDPMTGMMFPDLQNPARTPADPPDPTGAI